LRLGVVTQKTVLATITQGIAGYLNKVVIKKH